MSYLDKLRALESRAKAEGEPTKATKAPPSPPSVASVGATPTRMQKFTAPKQCAQVAATAKGSEQRKAAALAFLREHSEAQRACFSDASADHDSIILTVAVREPWGAVEISITRERFDAFALMELATRYPATSILLSEH